MPAPSVQNTKVVKYTAALVTRWSDFIPWLAVHRPELSERLALISFDTDDKTYCPIHGGESGEAFRVYPDFHETGGCVCNSCGSFASGLDFLRKLYQSEGLNTDFYADIDTYMEVHSLEFPAGAEQIALNDWARSNALHVAMTYLTYRGIPNITEDNLPPAIRGAEATDDEAPVMRTLMSKEGAPLSVLRTYLSENYREKNADMPQAKMMYPVSRRRLLSGGYFDLSTVPSGSAYPFFCGEGVETMMAVRAIVGKAHIHAKGGAANRYGDMYIPEGVTEVHICAERDGTLGNLLKSVEKLRVRGYSPIVHIPPEIESGSDWLDVLKSLEITDMASAFWESADAEYGLATTVTPPPESSDNRQPPTARQEHEVIPEFNLNNPDSDFIAFLDRNFHVFCRDTWFLHLRVPETIPVKLLGAILEPLTPDDMVAAISEKLIFMMESSNGNVSYVQTPKSRVITWFLSAIARGFFDTHLRPLRDVVLSPSIVSYMSNDMYAERKYSFLKEPGYDAVSRYYLCADEFEMNCIHRAEQALELRLRGESEDASSNPLESYLTGDIKRKKDRFDIHLEVADSFGKHRGILETLRREFLCYLPALMEDFHFASASDYANMLGMFITPLFSAACENLPFFLVQAPARGAGKTTLVQAFGNLWGGALQIAAPDDDEEMEKRMGTAFTTGKRLVLFDNLNRLDSPSLTNLLTSGGSYEIRKLGGNQSLRMPSGLMVYGTGNNPIVQHELARRIVFIDLDPPRDIVTSKIHFKYHDLPAFVQAARNQVQIKQSLYTCLLLWEKMGFPLLGDSLSDGTDFLPKFESFTEFAKLVTTFLYLFFPGNMYQLFQANQRKYLDSDAESDEITQFVSGWVQETQANTLQRCQNAPEWFPVSSLVILSERLQVPTSIIEYRHTEAGKTRRLGMWLSRLANRRFPLESGNWRIHRHPSMLPYEDENGITRRSRAYRLESVND